MLASILFLSIISSCKKDSMTSTSVTPIQKDRTATSTIEFYGLTNSNSLIKYKANNVSTPMGTMNIIGLMPGESIIAIDFRPATGQLYGLGNNSRIYIINTNSGKATPVGTTSFSPAINGTMVGFDFNPTVDRIRLVTSSGQNLRLHPETGALVQIDGPINPGTPQVNAVAYTNSAAGASTTTLYDIADGKLYRQIPPNNGTLIEVGELGISATSESGFDIAPDNSLALAGLNNSTQTTICQIDLNTGLATSIGIASSTLIGLAIPTAAVAYTVDLSNNLQIFNFQNVGVPINKPITGLQGGETILGIDMRPATGQLFALGSSSRIYIINMSNGAAAAVNAMPFPKPLQGTSFGFDFNPTVDRIRVVSNSGQNLRINPNDGSVTAADLPLNPGTPAITGAAYTNNFPGATSTVLFDIDHVLNKLYKQIPPNNGTLVEVGNTIEDPTASTGFDIGGTSNQAYAIFSSSFGTKIYMINTNTGQASKYANFPNPVVAFAVGLGF